MVQQPDPGLIMFDINRRQFLTALGSISLIPAFGTATSAIKADPPQQLLRKIPESGEWIPAIGMGTSRTFNAEISNSAAMARLQGVLDIFYHQGGRLLDTSPMYGPAEQVSGFLIKKLSIQNKLFTATKVWTKGEQAGIEQMQTSMGLLQDKPLDLIQIHNLIDWQTHIRTLRKWKEKGIIRYIGITHYRTEAFDQLEKIIRSEDIDWVQLNYSIATREAEQRLLPLARDKGVATMINRPYERGALFSKVKGKKLPNWAAEFNINSWGQFFLKYILGHEAVTAIIPATSKPKHMLDNMQAGIGNVPDNNALTKMRDYFDNL